MREEGVYMTEKGSKRLNVFLNIQEKRVTKIEAALQLDISYRQCLRAYSAWELEGNSALTSKMRGKQGNHRLAPITKARFLELITLPQYCGFKPTFMCEKIKELHGIDISEETVRKWMIEGGAWKPRKDKNPVVHQRRLRRARYGELTQIDASFHYWFEDRGEACALLVFIDDATGKTYGKFYPTETTLGYMKVLQEYIKVNGRPLALYPDKHSIFRINLPGCVKKDLITQFGRACKELDIELICANSPQAKGRVERVNQTLQDRLVKEMRLEKISNIEDGNKFLLRFWPKFNERFSVLPRDSKDAHRDLPGIVVLEDILCIKEERKITKNLEIQHNNVIYQITGEKTSLAHCKVLVLTRLDGSIAVEYKNRLLNFKKFYDQEIVGEKVDTKELDRFLKEKEKVKVKNGHPWREKIRNNKQNQI